MNNQEAKLILQAYRANGEDASDPFFAEALAQVRQDPELQKWFTEEMAFNARLQARLEAAVPIPTGLKSNLLALRKTALPPPRWWLQPMQLAAVTLILVSLGAILLLLPHRTSQLASFRDTMARHSLQAQEHVVFHSHDLATIEQWLQGKGAKTDFNVPAMLQAGLPHGCRIIDWNGQKATMICFYVGSQHFDLVVMDRAGLPNFPENGAPQFARAGSLMTAMWAGGGKVYLLTGKNEAVLHKILQHA